MKYKFSLSNLIMLGLLSLAGTGCGPDKLPIPLSVEYAEMKIQTLWPHVSSPLPSSYVVQVNGVEQQVNGNEVSLQVPTGPASTICLYNQAEGVSINETSAMLNASGITRSSNDLYTATPEHLFSGGIILDQPWKTTEPLTVEMNQRTHSVNMTLSVDNGTLISANAVIDNMVASIDLMTGQAQSYGSVVADFKVIEQSDGRQQIVAQMHLLGVYEEQRQNMELYLQDEAGAVNVVKTNLTELLSNIEDATDEDPIKITGNIDLHTMEGSINRWNNEDGGDLPLSR